MTNQLDRLAIHTITTKPWSTEECISKYAAAGVRGITFWRYNFENCKPATVGRQARDAGLDVTSVARGGFFPAESPRLRQEAIEENLRAIDETAAVGAPSLVLVCGAYPGQSLQDSRLQIRDGISAILHHAAQAGVILAVEPLHPMYAESRSAINNMDQANQLCESLDNHPNIGIACDVYHTWWDPSLEVEINRAAASGNLTAYHICDWITPTSDLLNDRALMGEGCIELGKLSSTITSAGFKGYHEVEIFSSRWWGSDQDDYLNAIIQSFNAL
ncbi:MAG: sugar phosphate isomerase/epimerase [Verrucomicrobiaceae bacterium]|nr:sugar phosphate isomerase/epimerase [Verrucomicrobiaceae bacterium]